MRVERRATTVRDDDGETKKRKKKKSPLPFARFVNATLVASQRTLCCVLENYQTDDGVVVPDVLVRYMNGERFLPFARSCSA